MKSLSAWALLTAFLVHPVLGQDESGWSARRSPGALPRGNPDDGIEFAFPAVPEMPPLPPIPVIPGAIGITAIPVSLPGKEVSPVATGLEDRPVVEILNPQWNGFSAGIGLLVLKPYISNNAAYSVAAGGPGLAGARTTSFTHDPQPAVQFWLAYDDPAGWGGRLRTFLFDSESNSLGASLGAPGPILTVPAVGPVLPGVAPFGAPSPVLTAGLGRDFLTFESELRIATTDLEGTYGYMGDDFSVQASAGLRLMYLRQIYAATLANPGDGVTSIVQELRTKREFEGCGPTASLFARHRLGCLPLAVYAGVRGSVLLGEMEQRSRFAQVTNGAGGSQQVLAGHVSRSDHTLPVTELEFGAEYGAMAGGYGLFIRAGVVAQTYWDAGGAIGSQGNLSLFGGQLAVGLAY